MIAIPGNVRVWLATGHTDMRRGFPSLARLVQESLKRDPHVGDLYVFRGRRGGLIKIFWHDGQGACLFTKRLERGRFLWPSLADGVVTISVAQLSYLLSGIVAARIGERCRKSFAAQPAGQMRDTIAEESPGKKRRDIIHAITSEPKGTNERCKATSTERDHLHFQEGPMASDAL